VAIADIVADVRRIIQDEPTNDSISTAPSPASSGTTISFGSASLWFLGDVVDVPAVSEQILITSADGTNPFTIVRGYNDTTAGSITTSHRAFKNPRFGTSQIEEAVTRMTERMWPEVYELATTTVTPAPTTTVLYDLPAAFEEIVELYQTATGSIEDIVRLSATPVWNVDTAIASSGKALRITSFARDDVSAYLTYKAKVSTATTDTTLQHLIALGTAYELLTNEAAQKAGDPHVSDFEMQKILRARNFTEQDYIDSRNSFASSQLKKTGRVRFFRRARWF
jgi:uncharacterized protein (DUF2132 family)